MKFLCLAAVLLLITIIQSSDAACDTRGSFSTLEHHPKPDSSSFPSNNSLVSPNTNPVYIVQFVRSSTRVSTTQSSPPSGTTRYPSTTLETTNQTTHDRSWILMRVHSVACDASGVVWYSDTTLIHSLINPETSLLPLSPKEKKNTIHRLFITTPRTSLHCSFAAQSGEEDY